MYVCRKVIQYARQYGSIWLNKKGTYTLLKMEGWNGDNF